MAYSQLLDLRKIAGKSHPVDSDNNTANDNGGQGNHCYDWNHNDLEKFSHLAFSFSFALISSSISITVAR